MLVAGVGGCGLALLGAARVSGFWPLLGSSSSRGMRGASVQSASGRAVMAGSRGPSAVSRSASVRPRSRSAASSSPSSCRRSCAAGGSSAGFAALGVACLCSAAVGGLVLRERTVRPRSRRRTRPDAVSRPARLVDGVRQRADRRPADVPRRLHRALPPRQPRRRARARRRRARDHAAARHRRAHRCRPLVGRRREPPRARCGRSRSSPRSRRCSRRRWSARRSRVLVPVLVAAGALAMSWNGLAFAAAVELSGTRAKRRRDRAAAERAERHRRRLPAALRRARRGHHVALRASPRSRSSRSPAGACCEHCAG